MQKTKLLTSHQSVFNIDIDRFSFTQTLTPYTPQSNSSPTTTIVLKPLIQDVLGPLFRVSESTTRISIQVICQDTETTRRLHQVTKLSGRYVSESKRNAQ